MVRTDAIVYRFAFFWIRELSKKGERTNIQSYSPSRMNTRLHWVSYLEVRWNKMVLWSCWCCATQWIVEYSIKGPKFLLSTVLHTCKFLIYKCVQVPRRDLVRGNPVQDFNSRQPKTSNQHNPVTNFWSFLRASWEYMYTVSFKVDLVQSVFMKVWSKFHQPKQIR